eukprot:TRINITY_DN13707_c0_g1_i10.p4 TRINITY_DN13707_c0_g1~~TRINITY_DN13707_c0_g1_i10.p4  ORF type:complete len:112 (+),score=0.83 TRINITY_DN13707_c0_g1_i10:621-956(+)
MCLCQSYQQVRNVDIFLGTFFFSQDTRCNYFFYINCNLCLVVGLLVGNTCVLLVLLCNSTYILCLMLSFFLNENDLLMHFYFWQQLLLRSNQKVYGNIVLGMVHIFLGVQL